ncbi:tetratricopeptide repeat protein [Verrucomicrobiaceae bacterium N1E253]|uniref:Tetratricopeptide repeat protein n=1 Tax=Oceaniferula marina TaxID=2748318 RepID=A0A851GL03_9BACT|nr:tetratricopeptide repeat protein [Oceaniferula marina]NWK54844.1 tetratricopeptide repeat protein [Oceaniferula marina]
MNIVSFLCSVFSLAVVCISVAAEPLPLSKEYWKDEAFLKSFNGSYQINARIEPSVSSEERGLLVSIQKLMAEGKREDALKKLQASPLLKTSAALAYNAGNIQFELDQLEAAEKSYLQALERFPQFRRAHRNLGSLYARMDQWDKAIPRLEEAIRLGDQDGSTYGLLAYGRLQDEQYASALQAYRLAQVTQPQAIDWKAGVAQCLQHLDRNQEAMVLVEEVIKVRPLEPSYYLMQASIHLAMDQSDEAISNLEWVRRIEKLDAENHLLLASLHLRAGRPLLARPLMLAALEMEGKPDVQAAVNALEFVTRVRNWELAREFADALVNAFPDLPDGKLKQKQQRLGALIDIDSGQNPSRGAGVLASLIKRDPLDGESLLLLAKFRVSEKRYQEAEMLLKQASQVEDVAYDSHVETAKLCVTTKRYRDALDLLDQALELRPSEHLEQYRSAVQGLAEASE